LWWTSYLVWQEPLWQDQDLHPFIGWDLETESISLVELHRGLGVSCACRYHEINCHT
jgi:hypothetical protein